MDLPGEILHPLSASTTLNLLPQVSAHSAAKRPNVLQRMESSVLNSLSSSSRRLPHQVSKLDLIDDTTLTSLPLAPPPPKARLRRGDLSSSKLSKASLPPSIDASDLAASTNLLEFSISANPDDVATIHEFSDDNYDTTLGADETFDELQDPIVLVEDYMRNDSEEFSLHRSLSRKASLANFKQRHMGSMTRSAMHLPCGAPFRSGSKRSISAEDSYMGRLDTENLEAIFGKIPGSDKLKYCDLCDKPLYEISSVIRTTEEKLDPLPTDNSISRLYNEFVCWECINIYERFLNELYEAEVTEARQVLLQAKMDNDSTEKLLGMFNSIRETYQLVGSVPQPPRKQLKTSFSSDLIDRLHYLSTISEPPQNGTAWLTNLRNRLRWKWRLNDLIPNPFTFDKQRTH